jgi:hypothetical protein
MINIPRSQFSLAKDIIYPEQRKVDKKHFKQNVEAIKKKQSENRAKRDHDEHYTPRNNILTYSRTI